MSAHRAGGHTPHEGWVPHLRCVEGGRGEGGVSPSHTPQKWDRSLFCGVLEGEAAFPPSHTAKEGITPIMAVPSCMGNSIVYRNHKVCDGFASLYDGSPSYIEL